jgi:hypothetical protein
MPVTRKSSYKFPPEGVTLPDKELMPDDCGPDCRDLCFNDRESKERGCPQDLPLREGFWIVFAGGSWLRPPGRVFVLAGYAGSLMADFRRCGKRFRWRGLFFKQTI